MRILIVSQYFWPENFRINDLAAGLRERGHEVSVLTGYPNYPSGRIFEGYGFLRRCREDYGGIKVHRVPLFPRGSGRGWRLALNYLSFVFFASLWGPFICREKYDLIFVYEPSPVTVGIPAAVLKKIKRAPLFFWVLDLWPESLSATGALREGPALRAVDRLVRRIYARCDRLLIQSQSFGSYLERQGVAREKIVYFPNWAEALFEEAALQPEPGAGRDEGDFPGGFRVVFAGNIGAAQDFPTILRAAELLQQRCPDIRWIIVGGGRMEPWVREQVGLRGLSEIVFLAGEHPLEDMPRFFARADVMLVTLRDDPIFALTIPGKLQSYLACGRPVAAALDGEGARVIRESGAGLAAPAEDAAALAEAVERLYRLPAEERDGMGQRGRDYYRRHFRREMLFDRLEALAEGFGKEGEKERSSASGSNNSCRGNKSYS